MQCTIRPGFPLPLGATPVPGGINFSIFSEHATSCTLVLFTQGAHEPFTELSFCPEHRHGFIFAMTVLGLGPESTEYAYRLDGPHDSATGLLFDPTQLLLDPVAKLIRGMDRWRFAQSASTHNISLRARVTTPSFDWKQQNAPNIPLAELIIYEMHLRGFTAHPSAKVRAPGTYAGMCEKISYLHELGVNCVEMLPIFEFNECENTRTNPLTGESLCNYWGYSTVGFFAPKGGYAQTGSSGGQTQELKELIRHLHTQKIAVFLDVVYNHTSEGNQNGPTVSFRGIDNPVYYHIDAQGKYRDFTGCGNTVNANHPVTREFIRDSLRYWAIEYHIDGFRFDLASALTRNHQSGSCLENPPLIEEIAYDPVLANKTLIAEAWDIGGLYQVGSFPAYGRWLEWNGKFRDTIRRFLRGDDGMVGEMVQRILGSPDLYQASGRKPTASINFITCHDGFTLHDLVSYHDKKNLENGESNHDGTPDNWSWNGGCEGPTDDPKITALRLRQKKNAFALLLLSQGIPMLSMGDECGRTQRGNNNAYCQDEPWNWFDWELPETNKGLFCFVKNMIAFRKAHPALRQSEFLTGEDRVGSGYPDISWHGTSAWNPDWGHSSRTLAFLLCGRHAKALGRTSSFIYGAFNMYSDPLKFDLPVLPKGFHYHRFVHTGLDEPDDIVVPGSEPLLTDQQQVTLLDHSCVILVGS